MTIIQEEIMNNIILDYNNGNSPDKLSKIYTDYSPYIIRENLKYYGVFKSPYFTKQELDNIKNDYLNGLSLNNIAIKYNRREDVIRKKLQELDIYDTQKYEVYTDKEISILEKYYPIGDWENLSKFLPNRDKNSITNKAHKLGIKQESFYWTEEKIKEKLSLHGFNLLSSFSTITEKYEISDTNGYLYYINLNSILNNSYPQKFSQYNPNTIKNIKTYIKLNNIKCELLSDTYIDNHHNLLWRCNCGNIFECSLNAFLNGKYQCNSCSSLEKANNSSISIEEVEKALVDKPYTMIRESFSRLSNGFIAITDDGYYVKLNRDNLYNDKEPEKFHQCNPYTIENIRHYIEINNIETKLLSTNYINNTHKMLWKCKCGNDFRKNWNSFYHGSHYCQSCGRIEQGIQRRKDFNYVINIVEENGYKIYEELDINKPISSQKISLIDKEGYLYQTTWSHLKENKDYEKFYSTNKYSIHNINLFLKEERNGEYECISKKYIDNSHKLKFRHNCGCIFEASLIEMQGRYMPNRKDKYYKQCPNCNTNKTESNHASILKQIFIHEYPDTSIEDKSCINPKTKRPFPTDIVNHRMKIAIEIQSSYHDKPDRKKVDKFKKDFWLKLGYDFYDPDIRDYSILEMVQIFFPNIKELPKYIDYNFSNCIDFTGIQPLLDSGYTILEISRILGIKKGTIQGFINDKKVFLPDGYKEKVFNIRSIIQLSKNGEYINRFNSLYDMDRYGYKTGTVNRVLKKVQNFAYGYYWVFETDYINGNYEIPKEEPDKFIVSVDKYDMNDNYIKTYKTIYEAEADSLSNKSEIYRVASGNRKSSRNEKWKFNKTA